MSLFIWPKRSKKCSTSSYSDCTRSNFSSMLLGSSTISKERNHNESIYNGFHFFRLSTHLFQKKSNEKCFCIFFVSCYSHSNFFYLFLLSLLLAYQRQKQRSSQTGDHSLVFFLMVHSL